MDHTRNEIIIKVEHLYKSFKSEIVLSDISLELFHGENLVVLGKSGAGKSVLLKCITGLIPPDKGDIILFDHNISDLNEDALNNLKKRIGYVFQGAALYDSMSVRENLLFPLERAENEISHKEKGFIIEEILENVGLKDSINKMPSELSGGMRKRAGLARALVLRPEIIMYDEPTTGLDPATSHEISELILQVQRIFRTSSIIVTHDMHCARLTSNRIMILENSCFIADGTYESLRKNKTKSVQDYFLN
ncbi:MAG: ATP-binding cassette domain-containing protein [Bacteroidales bacterium]|nr:ATP-binding cassette domain-containing protein [Bacteroidales bacterium]